MVKSHIIPKALTRNEVKGDFLLREETLMVALSIHELLTVGSILL